MGKILVVDDEERMVALLKSALAHRGHDVTGVTSGQEALAALRASPFDLVLTDLRMEPVDGMAVIEGVRAESPETAVVVITAYGEVKTAVEALRSERRCLPEACDKVEWIDEAIEQVQRTSA